jgi:predicted PurR-regulated permease PerM
MSKSLDLSPLFVLIMMAIGASVAGILGILLAVPCAAIIEIGVKDFLSYKIKHDI